MAKHASPEDHSFLISVGQHLGAALALVVLVAAAFWGIGQVKVDDTGSDGPVIANPSDGTDNTAGDASDDTPADGTTDDTDGDEPSTTDGTDAEPASEAPSPEPDPDPTAEEPSPDPEPEPTATSDGAVAPSSVSVQVLDAVLEDGSAAAEDVERRLRADGYRVVANNRASKFYEVTTVFYTDGYQAQAQQVADAYGWSKVEPKPDNLSSSVQVHVVVGRDEA